MKYDKNKTIFRKHAVALAALAICLFVTVTGLAASGVLKGFFRDITNLQGAVVGTSYEQATDEIDMNVAVNGNVLTVQASFVDLKMAPYRYAEKLGIAAYQILDESGKLVKEGSVESSEVADGQASVNIHLDDVDSGSYKLLVTAFLWEKKADQPMNINGSWECAFTK